MLVVSGDGVGPGEGDSSEDRQGGVEMLMCAIIVKSQATGAANVPTKTPKVDMDGTVQPAPAEGEVVHPVEANSSSLHSNCQPGMSPVSSQTTTEGPHRTPRTEGLRTPYCP
ncbi:hypothetical protein XENORESO_016179 [Xenotaenia resolanae]|uniref:Uncharacterized protein n=1 Tax=Xenotaenia resolanae TaxID=208358 RepID=A0ABV0VX60_9TELE